MAILVLMKEMQHCADQLHLSCAVISLAALMLTGNRGRAR